MIYPDHKENVSDLDYIILLSDAMKQKFKEEELLKDDWGSVVIGYKKNLYAFATDMTVLQPIEDFYAIGVGVNGYSSRSSG